MSESIEWFGRDGQGDIGGILSVDVQPDEDWHFSGDVSQPNGFTVPAGEVWSFNPDANTTVRVRANVVVEGTLRMRPAHPGIVHHLIFEGVDESAFVGNIHDLDIFDHVVATDVGLWVTGDGELDAIGSYKGSWTVAVAALPAGATDIRVVDNQGWQVGDTLAFTPTAGLEGDGYDIRTIASVNGDIVGLSTGLANPHPRPVDQFGVAHGCEVLNLTRNVRITGTPTGRAHIMWMHAHHPVHMENVEVAHMGPRQPVPGEEWRSEGVLGRYPLHWHLMGDHADNSFISGVVVHDCGHHAFVTHTSHGMYLDSCVAHDIVEDPFWWDEQAPTNRLTWDGCVASLVRTDPQFRSFRTAGFNLGRDDQVNEFNRNTIINCRAVGVLGNTDVDNPGFADTAGYFWPEVPNGMSGVWRFQDNLAHNCPTGFGVWQNDDSDHVVEDSVAYNCGTAINHGAYGNRYIYQRLTIFDCTEALRLHASSSSEGPGIMSFDDIDCRVDGARAIRMVGHTFAGEDPTMFRRWRLRGYALHGVYDDTEPGEDSNPTWAEFHDCDWEPGKPHIALPMTPFPGTLIRELVDGVEVARYTR